MTRFDVSLQAFWSANHRPETLVVARGRQQGDLRINREKREIRVVGTAKMG